MLLGGAVLLASLGGPSAITSAQADTKACLVHTIDTANWVGCPSPPCPPSTDPSGITLLPNGHLLISDAEVEEPPAPYFAGINLYEALTTGPLLATASTLAFNKEPTGVTINPSNGHLFFSDDSHENVFEVNLGPDGQYGTTDDIVTSFSTTPLSASTLVDPEGVAFGLGDLFVASGIGADGNAAAVYRVDPGHNGIFDGVPPAGDDVVVTRFDTTPLGVPDPEGVAFNSDTNFGRLQDRRCGPRSGQSESGGEASLYYRAWDR